MIRPTEKPTKPQPQRVFKTKWFTKESKKANITATELCEAIQELMKGQADDLGVGVYKKRLNKNMHRSIVLAKDGKYWIYAYLFAKKDRENIDDKELKAFRELADLYKVKTDKEIQKELDLKELVEICNDNTTKIQK